jgi:hypothetical protein
VHQILLLATRLCVKDVNLRLLAALCHSEQLSIRGRSEASKTFKLYPTRTTNEAIDEFLRPIFGVG